MWYSWCMYDVVVCHVAVLVPAVWRDLSILFEWCPGYGIMLIMVLCFSVWFCLTRNLYKMFLMTILFISIHFCYQYCFSFVHTLCIRFVIWRGYSSLNSVHKLMYFAFFAKVARRIVLSVFHVMCFYSVRRSIYE